MAMLGAIGPVISGVASIAGAAVSFAAMQSQADAEEKMAQWNADRQREQAAIEQSKGAIESERREKEGRRQAALARATFAQGGSQTDTGTPLLLEQEFAAETAWRSNMEMTNATIQQRNMLNKASATEYEGQIKAQSSRAQGTAALLGGLGSAAKSFGQAKFG